jgi:hypothetical protein
LLDIEIWHPSLLVKRDLVAQELCTTPIGVA